MCRSTVAVLERGGLSKNSYDHVNIVIDNVIEIIFRSIQDGYRGV
jgi:hypothetical protein